MLIRDIMSKSPVSVSLDDHLDMVKEIFDHAKFHHLLVVEEGKLFGVISDRDLLKAISPHIGTNRYTMRDLETLAQPVHRIVTRKPLTLMADASVDAAVAIFNAHNISCIPIVDDAGAAVGIVSWRDIMKAFPTLRAEGVLAQEARPPTVCADDVMARNMSTTLGSPKLPSPQTGYNLPATYGTAGRPSGS